MSLVLVTAPTVEPVTLTQVKAHLGNIQSTDFDALLGTYIAAVREHLDGAEGILGRALVRQTWDMRLDEFEDEIRIPLPPLQSVTSVKYVGSNGVLQTMAAGDYQVIGLGTKWPATLIPAYGECWPSTYDNPESVTVRFVAGYPDNGASPPNLTANIPAGITAAMLLLVGDLWKYRETVAPSALAELPSYITAERLLFKHQVHFFP